MRHEGKVEAFYRIGRAGHCKDLYFDFERDRTAVGGVRMSWGRAGRRTLRSFR